MKVHANSLDHTPTVLEEVILCHLFARKIFEIAMHAALGSALSQITKLDHSFYVSIV